MLEYENEKSETTFYPQTLKVYHKGGVIFWIGQFVHAEIAI